jgi:hypothetical protein
MNYRFIYSANNVLIDYSKEMSVYHSDAIDLDITHDEDCLYIGSPFPFNSFFIKVSTASTVGINPMVSYWNGSTWGSSIEVIDETLGLKQSGYITFQVDRSKSSWSRDDTQLNGGGERVTGLGDVNIYDMYWAKITFDASDEVSLKWIGHNFITDNDLRVEYPSLLNSTLLGVIQSGKTDWEEQRVRASKLVVEDLTQARIILAQGQIVDRRKLESMTISKTAELIYTMLGDDYVDQRREAGIEYQRRQKQNVLNIDQNGDADLSVSERTVRQGFLYR